MSGFNYEYELPKITPIAHEELIRALGHSPVHVSMSEHLTAQEEAHMLNLAEEIAEYKGDL